MGKPQEQVSVSVQTGPNPGDVSSVNVPRELIDQIVAGQTPNFSIGKPKKKKGKEKARDKKARKEDKKLARLANHGPMSTVVNAGKVSHSHRIRLSWGDAARITGTGLILAGGGAFVGGLGWYGAKKVLGVPI